MGNVHRIAGLRISRVAPTVEEDDDFWTPRESLPDLEPAEDKLRRMKSHIFRADSIALTHDSAMEDVFDPAMREENKSTMARATVYVTNMMLMVLSPPVGAGMLMLNILGGENLRTTLHLVALTGMATALAGTSGGAWLSLLV